MRRKQKLQVRGNEIAAGYNSRETRPHSISLRTHPERDPPGKRGWVTGDVAGLSTFARVLSVGSTCPPYFLITEPAPYIRFAARNLVSKRFYLSFARSRSNLLYAHC